MNPSCPGVLFVVAAVGQRLLPLDSVLCAVEAPISKARLGEGPGWGGLFIVMLSAEGYSVGRELGVFYVVSAFDLSSGI